MADIRDFPTRTGTKTVVFVPSMMMIMIAMAAGQRILLDRDKQPYIKDFPPISPDSVKYFIDARLIELIRHPDFECYEITWGGKSMVTEYARGELKAIDEKIAAATPPEPKKHSLYPVLAAVVNKQTYTPPKPEST